MTAQKAQQLIQEKIQELQQIENGQYNRNDTLVVFYRMKRIYELENDIAELEYIHDHR